MNNFNEALAGLDGGGGSSNDDIMPVTFEIQMYKTTASSQDTETSLLCTAEQPVFVKITATRVMDLKTVTKALLKIRKSGGTATGMALYYATANNTVYYHSSHVAVKEITSGGASYLTANLSNIVEDDVNNGLPIYLALVPAENSTFNLPRRRRFYSKRSCNRKQRRLERQIYHKRTQRQIVLFAKRFCG